MENSAARRAKKGVPLLEESGFSEGRGLLRGGVRLSKGAQESCRRRVSGKGGGTEGEGG